MASGSAPATPLLYACIAHHSTVLTEHTIASASASATLAAAVLPKISHSSSSKLSFEHKETDSHIHYIADGSPSSANNAAGLTYLVVAKMEVGKSLPFGFLVEIKKRFLAEYAAQRTDFSSLPTYGAAAFNTQLRTLMVEYGTTSRGKKDAFANVRSDIDDVRGIVTKSIEQVLERGERIDLLVDKTDRLGGSAADFRVRSKGLKRRMWWKNMKLMVLLTIVIVFLAYLLVGFGCGLPAWGKCIHRN